VTPRHEAWSRAYAKQARGDFQAFEILRGNEELPECHSLHFLQTACEKLCKAFLCGGGTEPDELQTSHAFIAGPLPLIARQQYVRLGGRSDRSRSHQFKLFRQLAREIELLAPQVNAGGRRPENCDYPWEDQGRVNVPVELSFPNLGFLDQATGRLLLKLIHAGIDQLLSPDEAPSSRSG
jgi:hypothetical protein